MGLGHCIFLICKVSQVMCLSLIKVPLLSRWLHCMQVSPMSLSRQDHQQVASSRGLTRVQNSAKKRKQKITNTYKNESGLGP